MDEAWVERRVQQAQNAVKGTSKSVPDAVVDTFRQMLAQELQYRLRPDEMKGLVRRLATANNPVTE